MSLTTQVGCSSRLNPDDLALAVRPLGHLTADDTERELVVSCRQARVCGFPIRHTEAIEAGAHRLDKARQLAWNTLGTAIKGRGIAMLWGDRGRGKTHLATLAGIQWHRTGFYGKYGACRYWTAADLMDEQRDWFSNKVGEYGAKAEPFEVARDCGLLVLDELNEIKAGSAFDVDSVTRIMDARYRQALPSILITNMRPDKVVSVLGGSVVDRIKENGALIDCNWDSVRDAIRAGGEA